MITAKDDDLGRMEEVVAVPDTALAKNQLEALRSRNKYLSDYRNTISELKVEISYLQKEVDAKTAALTAKNEELETAVKKHTQRTVELEGEWQRSADDYAKQIETLESQLG
jgi:predicted RNase H-like nuclease (RuvC/YqgF family)